MDQANGGAEVGRELAWDVSHSRSCYVQTCETILLVEDEGMVREVTHQVLGAAGFRVIEARTASQATQAFREERGKPDLLITDVVLPDRNGHELWEELAGQCADLRTIFISGYPENVVTRNQPNGGTLYLAKPFSRESLLRAVRQALGKTNRVQSEFSAGADIG